MRGAALAGALVVVWGLALPYGSPTQTAAAQFETDDAERDFAEASKLFADELYREAIQAYQAFRNDHPDHVHAPDALYYQARAALALGDEEEAVRLFGQFENRYPVHPLAGQARLALGKYFFESNDYGRATEVFEQILEDEPPPELAAKARYWMGKAALEQDRFDEAIRQFQHAADDYRDTETAPIALYTIGFTQVRQGQYDAAAKAFELLAARYPDSPHARNVGLALAEVYYELDDYPRTVSEIQRRMPNLDAEGKERATFLLAESYNQLRDSDNAIVYYRRITEGDPQSPYYRRALYGLAWNYYFAGVHQWAVDNFQAVREGQDDALAAQATYYQAVNEELAERPGQAIDLFKEYLRRWPDGDLIDHALFELGLAYYGQRMWQDAYDTFSRLLRTQPSSDEVGETLYYRGNTSVALGNFDDALADFSKAADVDAAPESLRAEVIFQKAWLLYRNERYDDAAPAFLDLYQKAPSGERSGEALFWAAESYFQVGALDRSQELFQQYGRDFPGGKQVDAAHYALGWVYFRQRNYQQAIGEFRRFLDVYKETDSFVPYRTDAMLRLADSYYALKQYAEAIRTYSLVAEDAGDYALYQIGQAYYNAGDAFAAIDAFQRLLDSYRDSEWSEEAQYTLGYIYFQNQDYDNAIAAYQTIIDRYPRDPLAAKAQYGIGDALFNAQRPEDAIAAYRRVLERYPNSAYVGNAAEGIQYAFAALGEEDEAVAVIDSFAVAHPDSPVVDELRLRQAVAKYRSGLVDEALSAFQQFVRTSRDDALLPEAYYYLGTIYADRDENEEAESYLRPLVDRYAESDRFTEAARRLGKIYLDEGKDREALAVYQRLETDGAGDGQRVAEARLGQGVALRHLGQTAQAEQLLQEAIDTAPDAPETLPAKLGLAQVYEERSRDGDALRLYREVAERSRDEIGAEALYRLGSLLLQRGDARSAIDELSRMPVLFVGFQDWVARAYLLQARAFVVLGQKGEANSLYDRVLKEFSGTAFADQAQKAKDAL